MKTIVDRVSEFVTDKRLLDIGIVGNPSNPCSQYKLRSKLARKSFGIDIDKMGIERARNQGLDNVYCYDICNVSHVVDFYYSVLKQKKFDVITATEILEHVLCFQTFFSNLKFLLAEQGRIFITTVNAFSVRFFAKKLSGRLKVNPEHTCWFDEITLVQLVEQCGFRVWEVFYAVPPSVEELARLGIKKSEDWMSKKVGVIAVRG